ncbi:MAG: ATP-binding cassette domain-containing protein [Promethearchaeati archaeon SRVP18_Atabeyarchaeia-1]
MVAVDNLNIEVNHGEVFGLLGPNGAGKTTTISMLCTILKPTSGTATVNGFDIVKQPGQVRKSIGIVFQEPSVDDRLTGRENMSMHANLYGVDSGVAKERIEVLLRLVQLDERADNLLRTYSGGMRRRLEIARGLIHYPRVLFLDEPTIGLDPQTREHIWTYIKELSKKEDITIILTTHYMEEADKLCDRIAIIDYGKIVALDTPDKLKESLGEETIAIKTSEAEKLSQLLERSALVSKASTSQNELTVHVKNGHETLPRIVETAASSGIRVESISLHEPDLGDVFLHYTGRAIREEEGKEYHGVAAARRRAVR